jgi:hypothetical protein
VSFTHKPSRFEVPRSRFVLPRRPPSGIVRIVALAAAGVLAAAWGLWHHYARELPPMRVPARAVPSAAPTYDADAGEIPVPEIYEGDGH